MRKLLTSLVIGFATLAAVAACDVQSGDTDGGDTGTFTDTAGSDALAGTDNGGGTGETHYYAIRVDDSPNYACSKNQKAHGADIDAVGLYDGDTSLGWFADVTGKIGDAANCDAPVSSKHTDFNEVKGAPDGTLSDGYVALGGGYVIGEFTSRTELVPAYTVQVIEVGVQECGDQGCKDEDYSVSAATDINCADNSCMILLSDQAAGHSTIPLTGI